MENENKVCAEPYTLSDWEYIGRMLMKNTEGYETFNTDQLRHAVKMVRHFVGA